MHQSELVLRIITVAREYRLPNHAFLCSILATILEVAALPSALAVHNLNDLGAKSDPTGNYWPLKDLIPTKVSLGPAADDHLYIVLHVDSDFLTRDYRI